MEDCQSHYGQGNCGNLDPLESSWQRTSWNEEMLTYLVKSRCSICLQCDLKLSFHSHTDHDLQACCKGDQSSSTTPNCVAATRTSISRIIRSYIKTMKCPGEEGQRWSERRWKKPKTKRADIVGWGKGGKKKGVGEHRWKGQQGETRSDGKKSSAFKKGKRIDERNKKVPVDWKIRNCSTGWQRQRKRKICQSQSGV